MLNISIMKNKDISHIEDNLLLSNNKLMAWPARHYDNIPQKELQLFCHKHARYGLPTLELISLLLGIIGDRSAIEIGAGHGDLGYFLGIPMTDSKIQLKPEIREIYKMTGQPIIEYPDDVEELEALDAVKKYKPSVVIGSWVTEWIDPNLPPPPGGGSVYGVKEDEILDLVDTYIVVGNLSVHGHKKILDRPHKIIQGPWIKSRSAKPELDCVIVWGEGSEV